MRARTRKAPVRVATTLLVASIATLGPMTSPIAASAQQGDGGQGGYWASPPPVDSSRVPADSVEPDEPYEKTAECVQRDLAKDVDLPNKPWGQQYLQLEELHQLMTAWTGGIGAGVKVAVIDTGVNQHPFLGDRVEPGGDYVNKESQGLEDCDGHGTEVAGIIAADPPTNRNIGFRGVAPDAGIVSIRQSSQSYGPRPPGDTGQPQPGGPQPGEPQPGEPLPPEAGGSPPPEQFQGTPGQATADTTSRQQKGNGGREQDQEGTAGNVGTLASAVVHAANTPEVQVMNISVDNCRSATGTQTEGEAKLQAAVNYAVNERDVVVVAAAGNVSETCEQNDQQDPNKPQTIVTPPWFANNVLSVAAVDESGGVADFSVHGPWVSVAAPGTKIISLDPASNSSKLANKTIENGEAVDIQGTSFAAPYVAGVAALVRVKYPDLGAHAVMDRISSTAQHPGASNGKDNFVGRGVINPMAALTATIPAEEGIPAAKSEQLPSDLPPADNKNWTPMVVALAGTGGGLFALGITLFTVHTIRRGRPD